MGRWVAHLPHAPSSSLLKVAAPGAREEQGPGLGKAFISVTRPYLGTDGGNLGQRDAWVVQWLSICLWLRA